MRSREEYREIYQSSYFEELPEDYESVAAGRTAHFRSRVHRMKGWFGNRTFRLLDIGAASGEFLQAARDAGIDGDGIEPSESACRRAEEKYGIRLVQGDIFDVPLERNLYDVAHMNHVLEHIPCPIDCLAKVHQILADGGYLMIEVPYQFGNIVERLCSVFRTVESKPFSLYSVHHPFFYTPGSLKLLLEKSGFRVREVRIWRLYLSTKIIEAKGYCRFPALSRLEKYAHLVDLLLKEKGQFVSFEICAQKA